MKSINSGHFLISYAGAISVQNRVYKERNKETVKYFEELDQLF